MALEVFAHALHDADPAPQDSDLTEADDDTPAASRRSRVEADRLQDTRPAPVPCLSSAIFPHVPEVARPARTMADLIIGKTGYTMNSGNEGLT